MAYAYVHDVACSWDRYRDVAAGLVEPPPPGLILHLAGPTDEGVRLIDVWHSEGAGTRFRLDLLGPALAQLGPAVCRHDVLRHLHPTHVVLGAVPAPRAPLSTTDKEHS
jgi:hypothetical protein